MKRTIVILTSVGICATLLMAAVASAQTTAAGSNSALDNANALLNFTRVSALGTNDNPTVDEIAGNVISVALSLVGVVFIGIIIYGGYLWGTARGNEERVERGRKLIFEATIGVIIIFGAYFLTAFIIQQIGYATIETRQFKY